MNLDRGNQQPTLLSLSGLLLLAAIFTVASAPAEADGGAARAPAQAAGSAATAPDLPAEITRVLAHPALTGARIGIVVRDARTGELLAGYNGDELFAPASVTKVFTSATMLHLLGASFSWQTPIAYRGAQAGETVSGDLWVIGRGAPDIVEEQLWLAARAVQDRGVRRITGDLVVDDRFFDEKRYAEGWPNGIQTREAYHSPISALMANYAAYREGSEWRSVSDAALHFGERFKELLGFAGVELVGRVRYPTADEMTAIQSPADAVPDNARLAFPEELELLYTIRSEPLGRLVMDLNKFSNNVVAETMLKTLGAIEYGLPGTTTSGLAVVARFLSDELGIALNSYIMADGSGLSDLNRFSPHQVVDLLAHAFSDFHIGPEFVASLKLSGLDGWNPRPFRDPPLVGEMRLKSGHIRGVNTLAGYAHADSERVLAFCIMINDHRSQQWEVDQRMAEISRALLSGY